MRGSRIFCQAGGGGGGVEARRPENSLDNVILSHQLILQFTEWIQWFYYRGEEGVQLLPGGGGVSKETYITCDFQWGGVEARRPENSLDNVILSHQLILQFTDWIQWFYYRGEEGVQLLPGGGGGCPKKPI